MNNKAFIGVFVLLVIIIIILIILAVTLFKRRKLRTVKVQDTESAAIGTEHVEFSNNLELQNMPAPHPPAPAQTRAIKQLNAAANSHPAPRPSIEQWRRRGFDFSPSPPATIPEEANAGQQNQTPRQGRPSATPIADSFRKSRIGVAQTTPDEESSPRLSRPILTLDTQQAAPSPYAAEPRSSTAVQRSRDGAMAPGSKQKVASARKESRFQEHVESPGDGRWDEIELSPPRQSMQSNGSTWRDSFESNLPESWGRAVSSKRFPLD